MKSNTSGYSTPLYFIHKTKNWSYAIYMPLSNVIKSFSNRPLTAEDTLLAEGSWKKRSKPSHGDAKKSPR